MRTRERERERKRIEVVCARGRTSTKKRRRSGRTPFYRATEEGRMMRMRELNGREREKEKGGGREGRCGNKRREGTRAGMSRLLVSQTRGRYFADQWQSTGRSKILARSSLHPTDSSLTFLDYSVLVLEIDEKQNRRACTGKKLSKL